MRDLRAGAPLSPTAYEAVMQRAILDCFKWNLAAADEPICCRYPLLVSRRRWAELAALAEALAAESLEAERELIGRPELHADLGLSRAIAARMRDAPWPGGPRYTRFDFHPTPEGLRITESNCDVAGGLAESSELTALFAAHSAGAVPAGDPARALAAALKRAYGDGARIGIAHLQSCSDDRQVALYLERRFAEQGLKAHLFDPRQLRPGLRALDVALDALFRFVPGDWLDKLPASTGWRELFASDRVANPLSALLVQSKRFPCVWPRLRAPLSTWRRLLPETAAPSSRRGSRHWVLKPAFGHEGVNIALAGATEPGLAAAVQRRARRDPRRWVAQRRFELEPIETPDGPRFAAVGVYVVEGRAAGAWARVAVTPLIDAAAQEAVVLVEER